MNKPHPVYSDQYYCPQCLEPMSWFGAREVPDMRDMYSCGNPRCGVEIMAWQPYLKKVERGQKQEGTA